MNRLDVTLVMCTCRRLAYFRHTVASLRENLLDLPAVRHKLVIDDNSSLEDRDSMIADNPDFEFVLKGPEDAGHARSLNLMLRSVSTTYALYWEDDSLLVNSGTWLQRAIDVISADAELLSISFDPSIENDRRCRARRDWARLEQPASHLRSLHRPGGSYADARSFDYARDLWPGFSLKPNLLHMQRARERIGTFDESNKDHMEYDYALRAVGAGMHTAILSGPVVEDIGAANSAYVLNGLSRSYDTVVA